MSEQNKKTDNAVLDDFDDIEDEIIRDEIREVFRNNPKNPMEALEEIGFTWYDDDYPSEEDEENAAVLGNRNQEDLVAFFQSSDAPSYGILEAFLAEKASDTPNLPLFRKYFSAVACVHYYLEGKPVRKGCSNISRSSALWKCTYWKTLPANCH